MKEVLVLLCLFSLSSANQMKFESNLSKIPNLSSSDIQRHDRYNACDPSQCQFCCLSIDVCGSQFQCQNTEMLHRIFFYSFIVLAIIIFTSFAIKLYYTDGLPPHNENDKHDERILEILISNFLKFKANRDKFKYE